MRCNMNPFQQKLYDEFEDNCFKLLGVGSDRVREVLGEKGQDIDKLFTEAWDYGGAPHRPIVTCLAATAPFGRFSKMKLEIPVAILRTANPRTSLSNSFTCFLPSGTTSLAIVEDVSF